MIEGAKCKMKIHKVKKEDFMLGSSFNSIKTVNTLILITVIIITMILFINNKSISLKYEIVRIVSNVRFKTITKNMDTKKFDNVTYYYSNKRDENNINNIQEYIRKGEEKTAPLFGQITMYPFNIVIFTTSELFGKALEVNPKECQAITALDSLFIPYDKINLYVFVHEYTHYKMNSFYNEKDIQKFKIPSWFEEGVAEYASSTLFPDKFKNPKIQTIENFRKLDKNTQMSKSEQNGQESYMQSYIAVKKIIQLKGINSIQKILVNTKSMTFYSSFEKVIGLSIYDFQKLLS